ncbi:MAG: hypothetical protein ABSH53_02970 [Holophaga sp.]|jgi:hypothetical protein
MIAEDVITTVWRLEAGGLARVAVYRGLPFGDLASGAVIDVPGHGRATCTERVFEGPLSPGDKTVTLIEIKLTLF